MKTVEKNETKKEPTKNSWCMFPHRWDL